MGEQEKVSRVDKLRAFFCKAYFELETDDGNVIVFECMPGWKQQAYKAWAWIRP